MNRCYLHNHYGAHHDVLSSSSAFTSTTVATIDNHIIHNNHQIDLTKYDHFYHHSNSKQHVIDQRWSSNSYEVHENRSNERIESSVIFTAEQNKTHEQNKTPEQNKTLKRHHIRRNVKDSFLSSFTHDKYNNKYDQPIRCPLRRLSNDSLTSTISTTSWNSSSKHRMIINKNNKSDFTKTEQQILPKHISFESPRLNNKNIHKNIYTPPKHPKRTTTENENDDDDFINKVNITISNKKSYDINDKNGIIISSSLPMMPIISRRNPIRRYCLREKDFMSSSSSSNSEDSNKSEFYSDESKQHFHQRRKLRLEKRRLPISKDQCPTAADVVTAAALIIE